MHFKTHRVNIAGGTPNPNATRLPNLSSDLAL